MTMEAVQDLYTPNLFLETIIFENNNLLPNFTFDPFIPQHFLNDSSYDLITNNNNNTDSNNNYDDYYYSNNIPTTRTNTAISEFASMGANNNEDHIIWPTTLGTTNVVNYSTSTEQDGGGCECYGVAMAVNRPTKRRSSRPRKNRVDIESQRMTHIAVERNRRKQMNDYLTLLRSLMPHSYTQRGDQASIVGGAINFVKELEHNLQCLSSNNNNNNNNALPFGEFFTFPQFSTVDNSDSTSHDKAEATNVSHHDVEVTMIESHTLVKIRSKRPPKQLSKFVIGLQGLGLTVLHLNLSKDHGVSLYSFSLKVEDESKLSSVDDIAGAVNQLLCRLQQDSINS